MKNSTFLYLKTVGICLSLLGFLLMCVCIFTSQPVLDLSNIFFNVGITLTIVASIGYRIKSRHQNLCITRSTAKEMFLNNFALLFFSLYLGFLHFLGHDYLKQFLFLPLLFLILIFLLVKIKTRKELEDEFTHFCIQKANTATLYTAFAFLILFSLLLTFDVIKVNTSIFYIFILLFLLSVIRTITYFITAKRGFPC